MLSNFDKKSPKFEYLIVTSYTWLLPLCVVLCRYAGGRALQTRITNQPRPQTQIHPSTRLRFQRHRNLEKGNFRYYNDVCPIRWSRSYLLLLLTTTWYWSQICFKSFPIASRMSNTCVDSDEKLVYQSDSWITILGQENNEYRLYEINDLVFLSNALSTDENAYHRISADFIAYQYFSGIQKEYRQGGVTENHAGDREGTLAVRGEKRSVRVDRRRWHVIPVY